MKATGLKRIGDPEQGVYVYRYPDFTSSEPWTRGEEGFFVIFKLIKVNYTCIWKSKIIAVMIIMLRAQEKPFLPAKRSLSPNKTVIVTLHKAKIFLISLWFVNRTFEKCCIS